jgi:predicted nuclease with TOPRIM domain
MAKAVPEPIIYKPEWIEEKYVDVCPFEPNRSGTQHICRCRNQTDTFNKMTDYKKHIKNKYHTDWVKEYGIYSNKEIETLTKELKRIEKENAILYGLLEKQTARAERYKMKYDKMMNEKDTESDQFADCD